MQPGTRDDLISSLNRELFTQSVESLALTARQITRWVIHCRSTMAKHCAMYAFTLRTFLIRNEGRPHFPRWLGGDLISPRERGTTSFYSLTQEPLHPTSGSRVQIAWRTTLRRHTAAHKSGDDPHEVYIKLTTKYMTEQHNTSGRTWSRITRQLYYDDITLWPAVDNQRGNHSRSLHNSSWPKHWTNTFVRLSSPLKL